MGGGGEIWNIHFGLEEKDIWNFTRSKSLKKKCVVSSLHIRWLQLSWKKPETRFFRDYWQRPALEKSWGQNNHRKLWRETIKINKTVIAFQVCLWENWGLPSNDKLQRNFSGEPFQRKISQCTLLLIGIAFRCQTTIIFTTTTVVAARVARGIHTSAEVIVSDSTRFLSNEWLCKTK